MRILLALALAGAGLLASGQVLANTPETEPAAAKAPVAETSPAPAVEGATGPAAPTPPAADAATKVKPSAPIVVANINLATQKMTVTVNGKLLHTWSVSSGLPGYPTPRGSFTATWMSKMHYSKQYDDAPMPHSVFFKNGAAIHGTYATRALGRPASHGCVRLAPGNAATFYNLVSRHGLTNTRVVVHGNPPAVRVASRSRDEYEGDRSSRRSERRATRSQGYGYPGDSYAWSGNNRGPYWSRY